MARLRVSEAWEFFGEANGVASIEETRARIGRYRQAPICARHVCVSSSSARTCGGTRRCGSSVISVMLSRLAVGPARRLN